MCYSRDVGVVIYTLGHSNRSWEEFLELLAHYRIQALVDVRAFPSSRKYPHFSRSALEEALAGLGIEYRWLGDELGGYRREGLGEKSPNKAWQAGGFRNYADYMLTPQFARGIATLLSLAAAKTTAFMCAERFWWRCHRRLISDHLVAQGHRVVHIVDRDKTIDHRLPPFARIVGGRLVYPGPQDALWDQ